MDKGLEFEYWICYTLPWQLNLSGSKSVGMETMFGQFADAARPLVAKAPEEFEKFFSELKSRIEKVNTFRAPKGHRAYPIIVNSDFDKYPNGKPRYSIQKNNF